MKYSHTIIFGLLLLVSGSAYSVQGLPFTTSFESGDLSDWFWGNDANTTVINTTDAYDGNYCAQINYSATENWDNYLDYYFGDHVSIGSHTRGEAANELWLKLSVKYDERFTPSGKQKLALVNYTNGTDSQRRYQVIVYNYQGEYAIEHSYINDWRFFLLPQNVGGAASPVRPGQWDTLKVYFRNNTPGASDGIVRMWVNNVLKVEYTNVNLRESTNFNPNKLILSSWVDNRVTTENGIIYHDAYYLGETDPDSGAPANAPPSPPVLLNQ
ncbi:MAG: hypothetical protein K1566_00155 [Candidatus Thiodiazotropha sp. (ex. Lucinisca nassula)]|nr:hypothetical protein [Candidatus Thiodiazotropha sp. (ex. Lucinisca nassula)]MBW9263467.1 hypothetical protein [Candidatus Thiodiazotropha sp. (ex. Lucinisca nassula)]MBW9268030.1 hypothetical protein [Candidatus Thiodiazotropha sp. (ex. Lucinisca nassula)]